MTSPKTLARIAGLLYLVLAVLGGWAELYVRGTVHVRGDAAATAANVSDHETLFRLGLAADILMATVFVLLGLVLHRLLHHVHARAAVTLMVFVVVGAGFILLNLVFHAGALLAATDPSYTAAPGTGGALTLLMLDLHDLGYILGGVFFGLWLLPMGYLAYRSSMFPTVLGVLLVIGGFTWIADPLILFALPDAPGAVRDVVAVPTSVAEFGLILYLLVVGVRLRGTPAAEPVAENTGNTGNTGSAEGAGKATGRA
ncbi:DUF4386 domain-containing protein [Planomonospora sp. ID91781]|uniref:DUF4386 domain-containing protein n=1 Tax=Planomonospora sp. ID91781 TaxID=2738135 RepID=UPI0018C3E279|nr:DUF4386 domain-containing protein [Planomonospora sp. ID91781]MBG0820125.1 DUF4386 domain-containing protein [Planomonospora sp. ID91781]